MRTFLKMLVAGSVPAVLLAACGKSESPETAKAPAGPAVSQPATEASTQPVTPDSLRGIMVAGIRQ